ncbi:YfiR family protein [Rhodocytophaga aerolata]|uniref:YfiR family protein n=1 Tax=Rhodocytophaga aerolata TaxID=455078 RepID=A0ABT8RFL6_9BACT|nr:YfiR family protein [Rhodocytophaga aerolata]MDO1450902.1 YfiR family protein [Rhodocytophaga aerolata]
MTSFLTYTSLSRKLLFILLSSIIITLVMRPSCHAQEVNEKIVPVFIYNFTKYIEWPVNTGSEFIIGVVGNTSTEHFDKMSTANQMKGRKIIIKKIHDASEIDNCQVVYIPTSEAGKLKQYVEACKNKSILLVSCKAGLIRKGIDINLFVDEEDKGKTKFEINKGKIESQGMKISKDLLSLAYTILD